MNRADAPASEMTILEAFTMAAMQGLVIARAGDYMSRLGRK